MNFFTKSAALAAEVVIAAGMSATVALADDAPLVTKAPLYASAAYAPAPASCTSLYAFVTTACPTTWYGITLYGNLDLGGGYQTHGTPFDPNAVTGSSELINPPSRTALWTQVPNGMSQSNIGIKWNEPFASGWAEVGQAELAFDPYSGLLANNPVALQHAINTPITQQELPIDSSRWGWLAGQIYTGVSSTTYGTLTFGRQNALLTDNVVAYDPMGAAYAFSAIGFDGKTCGAGDTEECRWTSAIKYRESIPIGNVGSFRFAVEGQPLQYGAFNPNNGAIEGDIGGDVKGVIPGVLSVDFAGGWIKDAVNIAPKNGTTFAPGFVGTPGLTAGFSEWLVATVSNQTSFMATLKYAFGSVGYADPPILGKGPPPAPAPLVTISGGYEWIQFSPPSDPQTSTFFDDGFLFNFNPAAVTGKVPTLNGTAINNLAFSSAAAGGLNCGAGAGKNCDDRILQIVWVGAKYAVTRNLDVIGAYYHYGQNQFLITNTAVKGWNCTGSSATATNPGLVGSSQNNQCAGTEDIWSAVVDWRFLPKWDLYIGEMFSQVNGGLAVSSGGFLARNNYATTAGIRFRF